MENIFYFFFSPQIYLAQWKEYRLEGMISAAVIIIVGLVIYSFLRYNRNRETMHFFLFLGLIVLAALGFILWHTTTIPDDICREGYKLRYVLNHLVSTAILALALFPLAGLIHGGRKYFSRIWEYFIK